jgi:carbon-monoxide dehydrogenase large subunit
MDFSSVTDTESWRAGWDSGPASVDWEIGDEAAVDRTFDDADRTVSLSIVNQRVAPVPLEPRALLAEYDSATESFTITSATQTPYADRTRIAETLDVSPDSVRVIAPAVGGGFGTKGAKPYPEEPIVAWAARHLSRPVKWSATRTEGLRTDHHGRDVRTQGDLALDEDGTIQALRVRGRVAIGAYPFRGPSSCLKPQLLSGAYEIPEIHCHVVGVLTNNTPLGSYRGAGRPESIYVVERLLDRAAAQLGIDPAELRRRNFIDPDEFPYETATGAVYDSGDYEPALDRALDMVDYRKIRGEQETARQNERYLGVGIASFVENTGSSRPAYARVEIDDGGTVTAYCGTADQGQGHATTFGALLSEELGVDDEAVTIEEGDTADLERGEGTFGSRSVPTGGGALINCARDLIEQGRDLAAAHLEVAPADVQFVNGTFHVRGAPDRDISITEVAALAAQDSDETTNDTVADDSRRGLTASTGYGLDGRSYAFGTHVAVVEVDPDSGELTVVRYVAVDDCGTQLNPQLVAGQVHGGVGQGLGQALYENVEFDDTGTLVTGSLQDYALPRASDLPEIETDATVTPSPLTPHGAKGVGESGTIAAPPAVVNAAIDALEPFGVETIDMPLHAERVWNAIQNTDSD